MSTFIPFRPWFLGVLVFQLASLHLVADFAADFEGAFKPVSGKPDKIGQRIDGEIDQSFHEDSSWADVEVSYSRLKENVAGGASAQRIKVARVASGSRVQLAYRDFPLRLGEEIELSFYGKSDDYTPITIRAVQKAPPYKTLWERNVSLVAEWKQISSRIPGVYEVDNTQFHFVVSQPGTVDLDSFEFKRVPSEVVEMSPEKKGNLLPNSSFPQGLTSPWVMQFAKPVSVSSETGPTGAPALLAEVDNNNHAHSVRLGFDAIPNESVTVSVHAREVSGDVSLALRVGPADANLWEAPYQKLVPLTHYWQRATHAVELPVSNTGYYLLQLAFSGQGVVELDGVQIEVGDTSPEFKRVAPVELSVKESTYQGLYLEDEDFAFTLTAYGELDAVSHIEGVIYDLYGNVNELGALPVPENEFDQRSITLTGSSDMPFGLYRLVLTAVDESGEAVSRPSEALFNRARTPRFADELAYDSYFGTHYGTYHLSADGANLVKRLGFNWVRLFRTFTWKEIEPAKGQFFFDDADRDLEVIEAHKLMPLAILGFGSPEWARLPGKAKGFAAWAPRDLDDWTSFVTAVFERYSDRVKYYEPWNEPYYASFYTAEARGNQKIIGSPESYLELHKRTYDAAPEGTKILWNTNALEKLERTETLVEQGILEYSDAITIHHYTSQTNPKDVLQEQVTKMRTAKGEKYADTPIWNSEGGLAGALFNLYETAPPAQEISHHLSWTDWYAKYFLYSIAAGVEKYFPYYMYPTSWWRNDYSFSSVDGKLSPVIMGMSNLAWQIDGLPYVEELELGPNLTVYIFSDGSRSAVVLDGFGKGKLIQQLNEVQFPAYDLFGNDYRENSHLYQYLVYLQVQLDARDAKAALLQASGQ